MMDSTSQLASTASEFSSHNYVWSIRDFEGIVITSRSSELSSPKFRWPCCPERTIYCKLTKSLSEDEFTFTLYWFYDNGHEVNTAIHDHLRTYHSVHESFFYLSHSGAPEKRIEQGSLSRYEIKVNKDKLKTLSVGEDGIFEVRLEIKMMKLVENKGDLFSPSPSAGTLAVNMSDLFENRFLSDFKIETNDVMLKVHKPILAMRSPVFKAMFESDMKESRENSLRLDYVDSNIVKHFMRYIYTDRLEVEEGEQDSIILELLKLADQYQMDALKNICCDELMDRLSNSNIVTILELAHTYRAENLQEAALEFVRTNKELIKKDELAELMSGIPKLTEEILKQLVI